MGNKELQLLLNVKTSNLTPEQVLAKFEAAGWHPKKFIHMGVIAFHPVHSDFNLSASGTWLYGHKYPVRDVQAGESWLVWVYPVESALDVL